MANEIFCETNPLRRGINGDVLSCLPSHTPCHRTPAQGLPGVRFDGLSSLPDARLPDAAAVRVDASGCPEEDPPKVADAGKLTYAKDVRPLLDAYCVSCHGGTKPKAGLALDKFKDEAAILKNPHFWEKIAHNMRSGEMPPAGRKKPPLDQQERLLAWIDKETSGLDCTKKRDPGRVTIRRLNRNEYNNTIRDLVGVKFRPADDFPSDDVGYGFDNIGDVLTMSPLLLEKYLTAADKILTEAFKTPELRNASWWPNPPPRRRRKRHASSSTASSNSPTAGRSRRTKLPACFDSSIWPRRTAMASRKAFSWRSRRR